MIKKSFLILIALSFILSLAPIDSMAMTVGEFAKLDIPQQNQVLKSEYNTTVKKLLLTLHSSKDSKGVEKSDERFERDQKRADMIIDISLKSDGTELYDRVLYAATKVPDAEISNVILGYLIDKVKEREAKSDKSQP